MSSRLDPQTRDLVIGFAIVLALYLGNAALLWWAR